MSQPELPENELVEIQRVSGPKKESSYIVFLKPNVDRAGHIRWLQTRLSSGSKIDAEIKALNGYVGTFEDTTLRHIRGSRDVERIEEVRFIIDCPFPLAQTTLGCTRSVVRHPQTVSDSRCALNLPAMCSIL